MALLNQLVHFRVNDESRFDEEAGKLFDRRGASEMWPQNSKNDEKLAFNIMETVDKICILYQLTCWIAVDDRFREKIENLSPQECRVDPVGWKDDIGTYYLLDDNRLYYREDSLPDLSNVEPPAELKPKDKKRKKSRYPGLSRKRRLRRIETPESIEDDEAEEMKPDETVEYVKLADALGTEGPSEWKCVCSNLEEWSSFMETLRKSREEYSRTLYKFLKANVLPIVTEFEENRIAAAFSRQRNREKALLVANRKRSSRIEAKQIRIQEENERLQREEQERLERERIRQELEEINRAEKERTLREQMREQRLREREEARSIRAQARSSSVEATRSNSPTPGATERFLRSQVPQPQQNSENWIFDCVCGVHGENYDDGTLSVACGQCEVWMHVACLSKQQQALVIDEDKAEDFVCDRCTAKNNAVNGGNVKVADTKPDLLESNVNGNGNGHVKDVSTPVINPAESRIADTSLSSNQPLEKNGPSPITSQRSTMPPEPAHPTTSVSNSKDIPTTSALDVRSDHPEENRQSKPNNLAEPSLSTAVQAKEVSLETTVETPTAAVFSTTTNLVSTAIPQDTGLQPTSVPSQNIAILPSLSLRAIDVPPSLPSQPTSILPISLPSQEIAKIGQLNEAKTSNPPNNDKTFTDGQAT